MKMMDVILYLNKKSKEYVVTGKSLNMLLGTGIFEKVTKMKYDVSNENYEQLDDYFNLIDKAIAKVH